MASIGRSFKPDMDKKRKHRNSVVTRYKQVLSCMDCVHPSRPAMKHVRVVTYNAPSDDDVVFVNNKQTNDKDNGEDNVDKKPQATKQCHCDNTFKMKVMMKLKED